MSGRGALQELRSEWAALWERCPELTPFQHPDWLIPWSRHFGGDEYLTVVLRRGGELVGFAPFFILAEPAGARVLLLSGTGNTDYLDLVVDPALGAEGASAMLGAALDAVRCDTCDLQQLRARSPLLAAIAPAGWSGDSTPAEACPVLPLPRAVEGLADLIPASHLNRVRRERRRLERAGAVALEQATAADFDEIFDALVRMHQQRWTSLGAAGGFGDPAALTFHREVARRFLTAGWLRLHALRLDGRIIASHYIFSCRGRVYNYLGGFDPEFARWSPGTLLMAHCIEAAVREGAREFDFLRGREAYKYTWGARDETTYRRQLR